MITAHYTLEYMALCNRYYVLAMSITSIKTRSFFTDQQCNIYSLNKTDQLHQMNKAKKVITNI